MTDTLKMTFKEVEKLVNNKLDTDRFEEVFNDIPMYHPDHVIQKGETHRSYIEDDHREYRWYIFKDNVSGIEHCINYTYNPEWPNDVFDTPDSIEIVDNEEDSDLYVKPVPVVEPEEVLSAEAQADKELWAVYQAMKAHCRVVEPKERQPAPTARINAIISLMKTKSWNMYQLRAIIIPVCIEYKLEDVSFWRWIQAKYSRAK